MNKLSPPELPAWLDTQLPFERYCVRVGDRTLHVMEGGAPAGRPILMLHGNPTWGFLWRKVANELSRDGLRLVMPDLAGLGLSDRPGSGFHTIPNHSAAIGGLIEALDLAGLVFVGQDWGGPIGLHALSTRRQLLAGMVILNTVVGPPKPDFKPTAFHRFARRPILSTIAFRGFGFPQRALHAAQGDKSSIRGDVARAYRWPLRGLSRNAAPLALARMVPDSQTHPSIEPLRRCHELAATFAGPSAIVWGDRDPVLGRMRSWVETVMPRAKVTRTQAGHFLQEEVPVEIASAIRGVVASLA